VEVFQYPWDVRRDGTVGAEFRGYLWGRMRAEVKLNSPRKRGWWQQAARRPLDTALRPSRPQGRGAVSKEILGTARLTTS